MLKLYRKKPFLFLAILSGLLLWLAWPPSPLFPLIFLPFALLLLLEDHLAKSKKKKKGRTWFWSVFLAMFIWNILTTFWVWNATPIGSGAWFANAVLMTIPWVGYRRIKRRFGLRIGLLALTAFWLCFEYVHFSWELSWPWLALGNVFAKFPQTFQWYEYTGVAGGSLWVLVVNILVYLFLLSPNCMSPKWKKITIPAATILLPLIVSAIMYSNFTESGEPVNVTLIQPNIDPYDEKFEQGAEVEILRKMNSLASESISEKTDYIVFPETSLPENPWMHNVNSYLSIQTLRNLTEQAPNAKIIVGVDALERYFAGSLRSETARFHKDGDFYYDVYNAALQLDATSDVQLYIKSRLVPGVERMPYPKYFRFLEKLSINLGGVGGSRGIQEEREIFTGGKARVGTAICYESVYPDYMNDFAKKGADILFVITNDGWWKDTPGYKQHLYYASLRAVEMRKGIGRSANTGVSAFINQRGDIIQRSNWWQPAALTGTILKNGKQTFFTQMGDYIGRLAAMITVLIILVSMVSRFTGHFKYR